ncbi:SDR family oxidoreductase [Clostridium sp. Cult2]|uniref:SDR family oxidoreductase n=1 Tax=Clostridium sp. Cult2 TaxID=2079003 RepID=UPI001F189FC3|nr:SDR family oxidoreductase [Clostridium sp. Cult2]MCF6466182.1 sorbitol-6-phosphate 2-dehydrogenase [Clostridium sp. Cult2]
MVESWLRLEGKTVIVTGGASGIGKSIAEEFLNNGANVVVCDINPKAPEFSTNNGKIMYMITDITKQDSVKSMVDKTLSVFGQVDILVNNAGINIPRLLVDPTEAHSKFELDEIVFDKVVNVNLKGVFFCTQAVVREMIKKGSGVIINISSECGLEGSEGQSIYAATKNAINSFTRSWAKELGKLGIRVVGVAPGILEETGLRTVEYETALAYTRGIQVEELRAGYNKVSTIPLGRPGKLGEVADLVCYLGSDRASYIHGVTYNVAGGKTRG